MLLDWKMKERSTRVIDVVTPRELAVSKEILPGREQALLQPEIVANSESFRSLAKDDCLLGEARPVLDAFSSNRQQDVIHVSGARDREWFYDFTHQNRRGGKPPDSSVGRSRAPKRKTTGKVRPVRSHDGPTPESCDSAPLPGQLRFDPGQVGLDKVRAACNASRHWPRPSACLTANGQGPRLAAHPGVS